MPATLGSLASLQFLLLDANSLSGSIPATLGSLASLFLFTATYNALSGSIPPSFCNATNLNFWLLNNNKLSGPIPDNLAACARLPSAALRPLLAAVGPIPGSAPPPPLQGLQLLENWVLDNNALSGTLPASLGSLSPINLWKLSISGNNLSGSIPPSLGSLAYMNVLDLSGNQAKCLACALFASLRDRPPSQHTEPGRPAAVGLAAGGAGQHEQPVFAGAHRQQAERHHPLHAGSHPVAPVPVRAPPPRSLRRRTAHAGRTLPGQTVSARGCVSCTHPGGRVQVPFRQPADGDGASGVGESHKNEPRGCEQQPGTPGSWSFPPLLLLRDLGSQLSDTSNALVPLSVPSCPDSALRCALGRRTSAS